MISHKYKFICPRIGKNASSSLIAFFLNFDSDLIDEGHTSILYGFDNFLKLKEKEALQSYFKFAFVRNPYDRLVSAYQEFIRPEQFHDLKPLINRDRDLDLNKVLNEFSEFGVNQRF